MARRSLSDVLAETEPDDDPTVPAAPAARTKPFRHSVDVPPARHYELDKWVSEASQLRGAAITGMAVHNVLLKLFLTDAVLQQRVLTDPDLVIERRRAKCK
jgi:hypothetical protein